jgi:hypothetical protein
MEADAGDPPCAFSDHCLTAVCPPQFDHNLTGLRRAVFGRPRAVRRLLRAAPALRRRRSNTGQTPVKYWSNAGRILVKRQSNTGQTPVKYWSNAGQILVKRSASRRALFGRPVRRPLSQRARVKFWSNAGQIGRMLVKSVEFLSNADDYHEPPSDGTV